MTHNPRKIKDLSFLDKVYAKFQLKFSEEANFVDKIDKKMCHKDVFR